MRLTEAIAASNAFLLGQIEYTKFAIVKHPVTMGLTSEYFHQMGRAIRSS